MERRLSNLKTQSHNHTPSHRDRTPGDAEAIAPRPGGGALRCRGPAAGGNGVECPRFWAGGFWVIRWCGAPWSGGRRASPCPPNGGIAGV